MDRPIGRDTRLRRAPPVADPEAGSRRSGPGARRCSARPAQTGARPLRSRAGQTAWLLAPADTRRRHRLSPVSPSRPDPSVSGRPWTRSEPARWRATWCRRRESTAAAQPRPRASAAPPRRLPAVAGGSSIRPRGHGHTTLTRAPWTGYIETLLGNVDPAAQLTKLQRLLLHAEAHGLVLADTVVARIVADVLGDSHAAELGAAHRAEVGHLRAGGGQALVVHRPRCLGIEAQIELILPAELEARLRERVVPQLRTRMPLGEVCGMRGDLVGDHAVLDVLPIRETEVLLRRDVAEHRRAVPADHGRADGGGDVVVAGSDVGGERTQRVEGRLVADLHLQVDVLLDLVHRDVDRALDHDLDVVLPRDLGQLAERAQLAELCLVVGVGNRTGAQSVTQ